MRLVATLLGCLAVSACAASAPYRVDYTFTERAVLPFSEAEGLTSAEIAQRLGFKPAARRIVTGAEVRGGSLIEYVLWDGVFGEGPCPKDSYPTLRWREGSPTGPMTPYDPPSAPQFIFRDGRYAWIDETHPEPGVNGKPPAYLVMACYEMHESGGGARIADYLALPVALPYLAVVGTLQQIQPDIVKGEVTERDVNRTLSTLGLGAAPPGGVEAWITSAPPHVTLMWNEAGMTAFSLNRTMPNAKAHPDTVRIYNQAAQTSGDVILTFEKGVLTKLNRGKALSNRHVCERTLARSFHCVQAPESRKGFLDLTMR
ncbi:MAG TPA: hypothetical protein VGO52_22050 [Hyphomonadaceae bacterium]|nr:hypothetical protein [Hyphomonadaceae bacterium]